VDTAGALVVAGSSLLHNMYRRPVMADVLRELAKLVTRELVKERALQTLRPPPAGPVLTQTTAGVPDSELLEAWLGKGEGKSNVRSKRGQRG
jgi:hypothetical protein